MLIIDHWRSNVIRVRPSCFPVSSYACCFGAVVGKVFSEPGVLESGFGRYPLYRAVDEDFAEEVEEEFVELGVGGDDVLLHVRGGSVEPVE